MAQAANSYPPIGTGQIVIIVNDLGRPLLYHLGHGGDISKRQCAEEMGDEATP